MAIFVNHTPCLQRLDSAAMETLAKQISRSHGAIIRVYNEAGNVIEMHKPKGDFKEP
jgi:hypothetical protein